MFSLVLVLIIKLLGENMRKTYILILAGLWIFITSTANAYYLDTPHNESNGLACHICHSNPAFQWSDSTNGTGIIDDTFPNTVCLQCHGEESVDPHKGPTAKLHSSAVTGSSKGPWSTLCTACHDPHFQGQLDFAYSDPDKLFLATGKFTEAVPAFNPADPDSVTYGASSISFDQLCSVTPCPDWLDVSLWEEKGGHVDKAGAVDNSRGLVLVSNKSNPADTYEVLKVTDLGAGNYQLKIKGQMGNVVPGQQFGVIYGQSIKSFVRIPNTTIDKDVKFFQPGVIEDGYGGYIDDSGSVIPKGLCQVCHTLTSHWKTDGSGTDHQNPGTENCLNCHTHETGFSRHQVGPPANYPPLANAGPDQIVLPGSEVALSGSASTDLNGDMIVSYSWSMLSLPTGSTAVLSDATIVNPVFTADKLGDYNVELVVFDGQAYSAADQAKITANTPPVASPLSLGIAEDNELQITIGGSDPDGNLLVSFSIISGPSHGTLNLVSGALDANGQATVIYTPNLNYYGPDSFSFTVNDGTEDSLPVLVDITVTPVDDPPTAIPPQNLITDEDTSLPIVLSGSDIEGDLLATFELAIGPGHGTILPISGDLDASGAVTVTYTPNQNYHGPDSFSFLIRAHNGDSSPALVDINVVSVNDQPIANAYEGITNEDVPLTFSLIGTDPDGAPPVSFNITSGPGFGSFDQTSGALDGSGAVALTYTPDPDQNGLDSFSFTVSDGILASNPAQVDIIVSPVNDPPYADPQILETDEDIALNITLSGGDPDGGIPDDFSYSNPAHGTLSGIAPDLIYTPDENYNGPDLISYNVHVGSIWSVFSHIDITVKPVNDPPIAFSQSVTTSQKIPVEIILSGSDPDQGDTLTFFAFDPPNGSLEGIGSNMTYTPNPGYVGRDSFTFKVIDSHGVSSQAQVDIFVSLALMEDRINYDLNEITSFDDFGFSVDISGDLAIVGFPAHESPWNDSVGAAHIYSYDGNVWRYEHWLPVDKHWITVPEKFSSSVAIDGGVAVVGTPNTASNEYGDEGGWVLVYRRDGNARWNQEADFRAERLFEYSEFGIDVAISGNKIVVGAPYANLGEGEAYVFTYNGSAWARTAKLTASEHNEYNDEYFGASVAIDGNTVLVGAPYQYDPDDINGNSGAAYVFELSDAGAVAGTPRKLTPGGLTEFWANFGGDVSLSGNKLIIGGESEYEEAYVFGKDIGTWLPKHKFVAPENAYGFGASVAIDNDMVTVSAPDEIVVQDQVNSRGAVYVSKCGSANEDCDGVARITTADIPDYGTFACGLAMDGDRIIVSPVPFEGQPDDPVGQDGSAYIYSPISTRIIFEAESEIVPPGSTLKLTWDTMYADNGTVNIVDSLGNIIIENGVVTGVVSIDYTGVPLGTVRHYSAWASSEIYGSSNIATITITVVWPEPTVSFTALPNLDPANPDVRALLAWEVTYADMISIAPDIGNIFSVPTPVTSISGETPVVNITSEKTYTITASNPNYPVNFDAVTADATVILPNLDIAVDSIALVNGEGTEVSWTTDAVAIHLYKLDANGDVVLPKINHFGTFAYLAPPVTTRYRVLAEGAAGTTVKDFTITVLDPAIIGVAVSHPYSTDDITVIPLAEPFVTVRGKVTSFSGEAGVTVNGIPAQVSGYDFFVNNVPLEEGLNTIIIVVTEPDGTTIQETLDVLVDTSAGQWIALEVDPCSGVPDPTFFRATLYVDVNLSGQIISSNIVCEDFMDITTNCDTIQVVSPDEEYLLTLERTGIYRITYTATVDDGSGNITTHSQEIMAYSIDRAELDMLLQGKWEGMKADLNFDVGSAMNYFTDASKDNYTNMFNELIALPNWQDLFTEMDLQTIEFVYARRDRAKYRINRDQVIDGIAESITYYIYFSLDVDGLWKIEQF